VVEADRVDWAELGQVVLVGVQRAVPSHHVEGREGLRGGGRDAVCRAAVRGAAG
jgi:hypothetical protein